MVIATGTRLNMSGLNLSNPRDNQMVPVDRSLGGRAQAIAFLNDFALDRTSHSIQDLLQELNSNEIISISCIDYREGSLPGFHLTSAGNIPHSALLEDLHLVLPNKKLLLLRCHTDCAKSKAQLPQLEDESDPNYSQRLEQHTLKRLWHDAETLLKDPQIADAIHAGLRFCAARFDVRSGQTEFFEEQSNVLIEKLLP